MPLMQKQLGGKANLLQACFGAGSFTIGDICGIWAFKPSSPLSFFLIKLNHHATDLFGGHFVRKLSSGRIHARRYLVVGTEGENDPSLPAGSGKRWAVFKYFMGAMVADSEEPGKSIKKSL